MRTIELSREPPDVGELRAKTSQFWIRSPDVALGVFTPSKAADIRDIRYWKWNRGSGRFRVTSLPEDRGLFPEGFTIEKEISGKDKVLSYKPESRLAFRLTDDGARRFVKIYSAKKGTHAVAAGILFARRFKGRTAELQVADSARRRVEWSWVDGPTLDEKEFTPELAVGLSAPRDSTKEESDWSPSVLTPEAIGDHLSSRLAALAAWGPLLFPGGDGLIPVLQSRNEEVIEKLGRIKNHGESQIVHGDFRPKNVLMEEGSRPRLCDSDHIGLGDWEWDLAAWCADLSQRDPERGLDCLARIGMIHKIDRERLTVYHRVWRILLQIKALEDKSA